MSQVRTAYFRGQSFRELGIIIRKSVIPPTSACKRNVISIPGGDVILDNSHTKDPLEFTMECDIIDDKLSELYALIQEEGALILPDNPDRYYSAFLTVEQPDNIVLYNHHITFNVVAEPYAYAVNNPEIICVLHELSYYKYAEVKNNGTCEAEPVYRVVTDTSGSFDLWVEHNGTKTGGCRITTSGNETLVIDIKNRIITKVISDESTEIVTSRATEDFSVLTLSSGDNSVCVSNVKQMKITLNERWF